MQDASHEDMPTCFTITCEDEQTRGNGPTQHVVVKTDDEVVVFLLARLLACLLACLQGTAGQLSETAKIERCVCMLFYIDAE